MGNIFSFVVTILCARLAAGLCFPALPGHHTAGAKGHGREAAFQPESCADSLQLGRGLPVCMYKVTRSSRLIWVQHPSVWQI